MIAFAPGSTFPHPFPAVNDRDGKKTKPNRGRCASDLRLSWCSEFNLRIYSGCGLFPYASVALPSKTRERPQWNDCTGNTGVNKKDRSLTAIYTSAGITGAKTGEATAGR